MLRLFCFFLILIDFLYYSFSHLLKRSILLKNVLFSLLQRKHVRYFTDGDEPANEAPARISMDAFLNNIHLRGKIKSDSAVRKARTQLNTRNTRSPQRSAQSDRQSVISSLMRNDQSINRSPGPSLKPADINVAEVITELQGHDDAGTCPESEKIIASSSALAAAGKVDGVLLCQKLLAEHYDDVFNAEMRLALPLANALWNSGQHEESMKLFKQVFYDFPLNRRKVVNKFRFTVMQAMKEYPCPEQVGKRLID